jgi:hypothetical protein
MLILLTWWLLDLCDWGFDGGVALSVRMERSVRACYFGVPTLEIELLTAAVIEVI